MIKFWLAKFAAEIIILVIVPAIFCLFVYWISKH